MDTCHVPGTESCREEYEQCNPNPSLSLVKGEKSSTTIMALCWCNIPGRTEKPWALRGLKCQRQGKTVLALTSVYNSPGGKSGRCMAEEAGKRALPRLWRAFEAMLHVKATLGKYYIHWNKKAAITNNVETTNALGPHHSLSTGSSPRRKKVAFELAHTGFSSCFLLTWWAHHTIRYEYMAIHMMDPRKVKTKNFLDSYVKVWKERNVSFRG